MQHDETKTPQQIQLRYTVQKIYGFFLFGDVFKVKIYQPKKISLKVYYLS